MNIIKDSWNNFTEEYAENFLYDADQSLPQHLIAKIFEFFKNPSIADIGCGNSRFFEYLLKTKKEFSYHGFDISEPLVKIAIKKFQNHSNFQCSVVSPQLSELKNTQKKFDIAICIHVAEICESPENLFSVMSSLSDHIGIIWFEYPLSEYSELEIRNHVSHDALARGAYTPYLRNRYSKHYLEYLLNRFDLTSITCFGPLKDKIEIYRKK
jgi:ubiquinone/menaquinone biosynthesis C-methylase UbiE